MDSLIAVINKIHDALSCARVDNIEKMIQLPQIAVIGTQSSGKSSVLESFVGREFLPRGSGIVTRRPLILKLVRTAAGTQEYAEFLHKRGYKFTRFDLVRKEIEEETDRETKGDKGVSPRPINLTVFSPNVVDLTLIDLPGFARVAVGNQPRDIEEQINYMVANYIMDSNTLILAVTAANVDLATSDSLRFAQIMDPEGTRTIGVITKLDLMDEGTDAYDILVGKQIPLRLGYVGVVCRGQMALTNGQSVSEAVAAEQRFFQSHPRYRAIADKCGTKYLSKRLNEVLTEHIQKCIPELKRKVQEQLQIKRKEYEKYIPAYGEKSPSTALLDRIRVFSTAFQTAFSGGSEYATKDELFGGARIRDIFVNRFPSKITMVDTISKMTPEEIHTETTNMASSSGTLFLSDDVFEQLAKGELNHLETPSIDCADYVHREMMSVLNVIARKTLGDYPRLFEAVLTIVSKILDDKLGPTKEMIHNLIKMESTYVNKSNPDFEARRYEIMHSNTGPKGQDKKSQPSDRVVERVGRSTNMRLFGGVRGLSMSPADIENAELMRSLVVAYVNVIKDKIKDVVPKTIMCFLINSTMDCVGNTLVETLYKGDFEKLMAENDELVRKRKEIRETLVAFEKASEALSELYSVKL